METKIKEWSADLDKNKAIKDSNKSNRKRNNKRTIPVYKEEIVTEEDKEKKLIELKNELMKLRSQIAQGVNLEKSANVEKNHSLTRGLSTSSTSSLLCASIKFISVISDY